MNKKILVTGAKGQLGETIKEYYSKNIIGLDFFFLTKTELDITNKFLLDSFFNKNKFDYCINCAAYTNVEQAEKTPEIAFKINAEGVKQLAERCKLDNIILIHISTDYVFDGKKKDPYSVHDITNPINAYGKSKLIGEQYIQDILTKYFIVRTSWLYSKKHGKNFYKTILNKIKLKEQLIITNEQTGCPTDTVNLSRYIIDLIVEENNPFGIYHYCDNEVMTWYAFAKKILIENNLLDKARLKKGSNYRTLAERPKNSILKN